MKKSTCKLTSLVLTLMFLLSLLCVNVAEAEGEYIAVSDSVVTRIEGENYTSATVTPNIRKMNTDDDVTKAVNYASFNPTDEKYEGQDFIVAYTVNVTLPGNYGISAVASKRSETYTSDWTLYANTESNAVSSFIKTGDVATTSFFKGVFVSYTLGSIYLGSGENTIYWKVNKADTSSGLLQAALDYIELTPPSAPVQISASEATRIEGESYVGTTHRSMGTGAINGSADGAKIMNVDETTSTKYITAYNINVVKAGFYSVKAAGSLKGNNSFSDWTIYVNDTSNTPSSYTAAGELFRVNGIGPDAGDTYDCGEIYLNSGVNTIYWSFGKAKGQNKIFAALDYIELTPPTPVAVSDTVPTRVEGENYFETTHASVEAGAINGSANGAKIMDIDETTSTKYTVSYDINVAKAGFYSVKAAGSLRQDNLSAWTIYVNESSNALSTYTAAGELFRVNGIGANAGDVYDCGRVYLEAGANTIYWSFGKAKDRNKIFAALDYIELTPPTPVAVSDTVPTRVEGENYFETTHASVEAGAINGSANGAKIMDIDETTSTKYTVSYDINVAKAGFYSVKAAGSLRQDNLSAWTIYVNESSNALSTYTAAGELFRVNGIGANAGDVYDCGRVYLEAGANTIYWSFGKAKGRNKIFAALDYIELTPTTPVAVSDTLPTRIEGENYFANTHESLTSGAINGSANGAKIMNIDETTSAKYTASYKLNVATAGYYGIKAAGSLRQDNLSAWTIYVNDSSNVVSQYTAMGELFRVNGIGADSGDVYDCGRLYLEAGENAIYWSFGKAKTQNKIYAALDYIELTPQIIFVSPDAATKVEGENYTNATLKPNVRVLNNPDDGQKAVNYTSFTPGNYAEGQKFITEYALNTENAGYYNLTAVATEMSKEYTSDWSIYINSDENPVSEYTQVADVETTSFMKKNFKEFECGTVYLEKGSNTLYWKVNEADLGADGTTLQAALDYFVLTPIPVISVSTTGNTQIEGEDYTDFTVEPNIRKMNDPDDGQKAVNYVSFNPANHSGQEFIVKYAVNVENAGYYGISTVATIRSQTYTSDWSIYADTADNSVSKYEEVADVETTSFMKNNMKVYDCGRIFLEEGLNTICWKVNEADLGADGTTLQAALDYFVLTPPVAQIIEVGEETVIEAETDLKGVNALGASDDKIFGVGAERKENTISLDVVSAGNYMVEVCGTNGRVSVKFDDGDAITLGSASTIKTNDGSYFVGGLYPYDTYVLSNGVSLTAGSHTVTVSLNGDSKGAAADYVKLTKMTEPSGVSISTSSTMNVGGNSNITLNGVNIDDMYMVTYSSNKESVAIVDGNGKITATGAGTAIIEALVKKYVISEGILAQANVTVNTSDILYISDAEVSDGTFTAKITKTGTLKDAAKACIAVYEHNNLKSVNTVNIGAAAGTQNISETLTAESGDIVEIFVWYASDMEPVCNPVCVKIK